MKQQVEAATKRELGAFLVAREFGRGVDLKMQKDAMVLVIVNGAA